MKFKNFQEKRKKSSDGIGKHILLEIAEEIVSCLIEFLFGLLLRSIRAIIHFFH